MYLCIREWGPMLDKREREREGERVGREGGKERREGEREGGQVDFCIQSPNWGC